MGLSLSSPLVLNGDSKQSLEYVVVKSIVFGDGEQKTPVRSISFKSEDPELQILQSLGSGRMLVEGSVSFRTKEIEIGDLVGCPGSSGTSVDSRSKEISCLPSTSDGMDDIEPGSPFRCPSSPKHEAAIKLQKVYKSFRTRRKLADCAVLIEQSWWKILDFAELKHSSISFFDLEKHESPISRWSRARTRVAKVGKGLSKNSKARKLAIQHWLEAIDPRHRYGHNLHFYYVKWLHSESNQPFFYWIDKCPRSKLQPQCIKYLGPAYEVAIEDGKLFYRESGDLLDTTGDSDGSKWIFVLSSSKAVWPHSGHYRPTPENFQGFISFLRESNVDLTDVKLDSTEEDEESSVKKTSVHSRSNSSDDSLIGRNILIAEENETENLATTEDNSTQEETAPALATSKSKPSYTFSSKLTNLQISSNDDLLEGLKRDYNLNGPDSNSFLPQFQSDGDEPEELFAVDEQENHHEYKSPSEELGVPKEEIVSEECIIRRISSHSYKHSFQLGQHLACRWSTGAGPRIGCVRDYPSGLQSHALEQVSLSPRTIRPS